MKMQLEREAAGEKEGRWQGYYQNYFVCDRPIHQKIAAKVMTIIPPLRWGEKNPTKQFLALVCISLPLLTSPLCSQWRYILDSPLPAVHRSRPPLSFDF